MKKPDNDKVEVIRKHTDPLPKPKVPKEATVRAEVTVKTNCLPPAQNQGKDRVLLIMRMDDRVIEASVKAKTWRKVQKTSAEFDDFVLAVSGKLGKATGKGGFEITEAGVSVFEKKTKQPKPDVPESE